MLRLLFHRTPTKNIYDFLQVSCFICSAKFLFSYWFLLFNDNFGPIPFCEASDIDQNVKLTQDQNLQRPTVNEQHVWLTFPFTLLRSLWIGTSS